MRLSQIGELSLLEQIRKRFEKKSRHVVVGIGDDAAVLKPLDKYLLVTSDTMTEGIHFNTRFVTPYQLGFKIISVNVSDIYAMGGRPYYVLLTIAVSNNTSKTYLDRFFDGVHAALHLYKAILIGGDLSSTKNGMTLSATVIGYAKKYIRRSGASRGDKIYVTGNLGNSACGLELLKKIKQTIPIQNNRQTPGILRLAKKREVKILKSRLSSLKLSWKVVEPLVRRHLLPLARDPKNIARHVTSMIDISDGLLIDLTRLCDESKVGARIYTKNIPISSQTRKAAACLGISPIQLSLSGGEDYELLFTAPVKKKVNAIPIGEITESERSIVDHAGKKKSFSAEGYQHFV